MAITNIKCSPSTWSGRMNSQNYIRVGWAVPNRYHSRCTLCGHPLAPGAGAVQRSDDHWVVFC